MLVIPGGGRSGWKTGSVIKVSIRFNNVGNHKDGIARVCFVFLNSNVVETCKIFINIFINISEIMQIPSYFSFVQ